MFTNGPNNTNMHIRLLSLICFLGRYARQVAEFFEFVKKKKDDPAHKVGEVAKSIQPQLLLPHRGGLWVPDGKHFLESALKSFDFSRAMP